MIAQSGMVPVTVIGGYLGAGKTTLINRLLRADHGKRLTVLVNDFGEINIDVELIASHDGRTISLTNGCVCCSIAGDLGAAIREAAAGRPQPDQILIEASGVADPGRIANHALGWQTLRLAGVITLIDPLTVIERSTDKFVGATVRRQIHSADRLLMTRTDQIDTGTVDRVVTWLGRIAPGKTIWHAAVESEGFSDWTALLDSSLACDAGATNNDTGSQRSLAGHISPGQACVWRPTGTVDHDRLVRTLTDFEPVILRAKGWLPPGKGTATPALLQMAGGRIELTSIGEDTNHTPLLSLILRDQPTQRDELLGRLNSCCH